MNQEVPEDELGFQKEEKQEIKLPTSTGSQKSRGFHRNIYFCFIDYTEQSL